MMLWAMVVSNGAVRCLIQDRTCCGLEWATEERDPECMTCFWLEQLAMLLNSDLEMGHTRKEQIWRCDGIERNLDELDWNSNSSLPCH